jgi:hypothetical protein
MPRKLPKKRLNKRSLKLDKRILKYNNEIDMEKLVQIFENEINLLNENNFVESNKTIVI